MGRQPSVYMTVGRRRILLLVVVAGSLPAGLYAAALLLYIVNITSFSRVTLIRKLQLTSILAHFHAPGLPCSPVKSRDDPISDCRVDSAVPYSFLGDRL